MIAFVAFHPTEGLAAGVTKLAKPKIIAQPVSALSADFGSAVTLTVAATSGEAPSYIWTKDGAVVPGATSNSLTITVDEMTDAGRYLVIVSNRGGSVKSNVTVLKVNLAPTSLPAGTALMGSLKIKGETTAEDGAYVVGDGNIIDDPEDTTDKLSYTYSRLSDKQARLVVTGTYFLPDLGVRPYLVEQFLFTFSSANADGEREAKVTYNASATVTVGNKSKTFKVSGSGSFVFVPPGLDP